VRKRWYEVERSFWEYEVVEREKEEREGREFERERESVCI
jgi:hypothetical protein